MESEEKQRLLCQEPLTVQEEIRCFQVTNFQNFDQIPIYFSRDKEKRKLLIEDKPSAFRQFLHQISEVLQLLETNFQY